MKTMNFASFEHEDKDKHFLYKEKEKLDIDFFKNFLTSDEFDILNLVANGFSIKEIAKLTKKTKQNIYTTKHKAIKKAKTYNNKVPGLF